MSDRVCDCMKSVTAMIPMPISHVAQSYAKRYCEWGLPPEAIVIGILELLIGPGLQDWDHDNIKEEHFAITRALMDGREGISILEEAAKSENYSKKIILWRDICKQLRADPNLSTEECRAIYSRVLSSKILSVSAALEYLYSLRPNTPKTPTPEGTIKASSPRQQR